MSAGGIFTMEVRTRRGVFVREELVRFVPPSEIGAAPEPEALGSSTALCLRALERAAETGARCAHNAELCEVVGWSSVASAASAVRALETRGFITVRRFQCARQVTITASGRSTAEPRSKAAHWRDRFWAMEERR